MNAYLNLENLTVGYGAHAVIEDIGLQVKKGEILTLIGANGAGKSTILKTIIKQLPPLKGAVMIEKKGIADYSFSELSKTMAVVLTERIRPELMTCREVVAMGRYPYTGRLGLLGKEDEEKVAGAMRAVHAEEVADKDFNATSDGQKQRVLLARALCQEPELLILDEPTSFLDIRYKLELLSILRNMARQKGITVVMSLHEIDLAMKISDRVVCVKGDRIFCEGSPEEVLDEGVIRSLYGIEGGHFDPLFGSLELPRAEGRPEVLVLSDSGRGIPIYRRLQKEGRPFAAAVVYRNDQDYQVARYLASEIVTEEPFKYISDENYEKALSLLDECKEVYDAGLSIGECNARMAKLRQEALDRGKLS